jgi:hypothetical protein
MEVVCSPIHLFYLSDCEVPNNKPKRFELKKWNAVALWTWDICVENCAICRNQIMDMCIEAQANPDGALGIVFLPSLAHL